ncbi:hypothetical protein VPHK290_0033 [Vibrio phage K290]
MIRSFCLLASYWLPFIINQPRKKSNHNYLKQLCII